MLYILMKRADGKSCANWKYKGKEKKRKTRVEVHYDTGRRDSEMLTLSKGGKGGREGKKTMVANVLQGQDT